MLQNRNYKKIFVLFVCIVSLSFGQINIKDAENAYFHKDYKKSFSMFQDLANDGNVKANLFLGTMYYLGYGVKRDYKKAFTFFTKASNNEIIVAKSSLAEMYLEGHGVKQDYKKAFELFKIVADKIEFGLAQNNVGYLYSRGKGVEKNYKEAFKYYLKACNNNYYESCNALGYFYKKGITVKKDNDTARKYYKKACDNKIQGACESLKNLPSPVNETYSYLKMAFFFLLILFIIYRTGKK